MATTDSLTGTMTRSQGVESYAWVRCAGCGNGLWRAYADRLVMPLTLRGGQKRLICIPRDSAHAVTVVCEKCGTEWTSVAIEGAGPG